MATTLSKWTIDPVHSSVEFSLDYMGFSTYRTGFRALEGSLEFDPARPASASVNASIPAASVDVTNERLMSRLMDPDLLGGKDHPTITFRSTRVESLDPSQWKVTGDLTIHGVAHTISAILPQNARSRRVAERSGARAAGQMEVVGLAWVRYVWPLDTGGAPQAQPASTT
jgi:polyisoprenoid-binding protein YceI